MLDFRSFSQEDWDLTPPAVKAAFIDIVEKNNALEKSYAKLLKDVEKKDTRLSKNSNNSSKPPSSDNPFSKKKKSENKPKNNGKPGAKKGHKGHSQKLVEPTNVEIVFPTQCVCGGSDFKDTEAFYTHQEFELPEIVMDVNHFILHKGQCCKCGKTNKAVAPPEHQTGFGPRLTALIGDLAGNHGCSRTSVQEFCATILNFHICLGAIQKVVNRCSESILPHYNKIAGVVRKAYAANIDETSYPKNGVLAWLWVMATSFAALFMIHPNRSKAAFEELIEDWAGILISDGYGVYKKWAGLRQTCLAHLIRTARGLEERADPEISKFGKWAKSELLKLCKMAKEPPTLGQWNAFYARLIRLIALHYDRKDDAGKFARRLHREIEHLWVFLKQEGVAPTNNHAERMLRFGVLWRKRSQGTASEKGQRWVERFLTLRQTCHMNGKSTYAVLVEAVTAYFKDQEPDLDWIENLE